MKKIIDQHQEKLKDYSGAKFDLSKAIEINPKIEGIYYNRGNAKFYLKEYREAIIDYNKIPKHKNWPTGIEWDEYYFFGGEDYELIFSLPRKWANNLLTLDKSISEIGYFINGEASVEFKNLENDKFMKKSSFSHF